MNESNILKYSRLIARVIVGLLFVTSAVMKLITIDSFELYIYGFRIFSFLLTSILSRLLIATEFFIGFCLIFKIYYNEIRKFTFVLLTFFTIFLVYVAIFRNDENCNCFGDIVQLTPIQSIVKNVIMALLLLFAWGDYDHDYKTMVRKILIGIFITISLVVPYLLVPNDFIYNKIYSEKENINTIAFDKSLADSTYIGYLEIVPERADSLVIFELKDNLMDVSDGRYIVNYVLAGCKYCRMGAERLKIMFDSNSIDNARLKFVVGGINEAMSLFITTTGTYNFDHWRIGQQRMMEITYGRFPLYVFVEDGKIIDAVDFRHLDEDDVVEFLGD